jgi:hypothetical protein
MRPALRFLDTGIGGTTRGGLPNIGSRQDRRRSRWSRPIAVGADKDGDKGGAAWAEARQRF